jgi:hypothetical protein
MPIPAEIPISKTFTQQYVREIEHYAAKRLESIHRGLMQLRGEKIQKWRKVYNGEPREKVKSFPWQNASNVVVQIVGSYVDQLVAKIVMGIFAVDPLFVADLAGEWQREEKAEEQRTAIEEYLAFVGMEPGRLNILPKYTIWIRNMVKYGFGAIKLMPEYSIEKVAQRGTGEKATFTNYTRHEGPVALPIQFEDFLMPATTVELCRAPILLQRARLQRFDLEAMRADPTYDKKAIDEILTHPTRQGPSANQREIESTSGAKTDSDSINDEWDIYEAWFPYQIGKEKFRIISTMCADDSGTNARFLKSVFNWLPDNSDPYIGARLGSDGERAYGFGFCEMLADVQEEVSAIHNRRGDASTAANTNIFRVDSGSQIDSQFSVYPNAIFSGVKDSFEVIALGRTASETIKDEQMALQEATDRAGIGPSASGQGAGTVNKKGAYSAMGTFAVMQEGNTRANLNVTEFRQSHYSFGRLALLYFAHFGVPDRDRGALGKQGEYLSSALENVRSGRIVLPIRAATGSVNKEIEKQNLMLLLNNTRAHWQMVNQLLQGAANPMAPPEMQDYMIQVILASNLLMRKICRDFGVSDPSAVLPEPLGLHEKAQMLRQGVDQQKQLAMGQPQVMGGPQEGQNPRSVLPQPQAPGAPGAGTDQNLITQ